MFQPVHLLFLFLVGVAAYQDWLKHRVPDVYVITSLILLLIYNPTQLGYEIFVAALLVAWTIALIAPGSLSWADVLFTPAWLIFCLSLFDFRISFPFVLAMILFIAINYKALKKPYPLFVLLFYVYAVIFVCVLALPFYPVF